MKTKVHDCPLVTADTKILSYSGISTIAQIIHNLVNIAFLSHKS